MTLLPFDTHRNRYLIDTHHSIDRTYDGRGVDKQVYPTVNSFKKDCNVVIKRGIDKILDEHNDRTGTYLIHSNSTHIGIVINWRQDRENWRDSRNHAIIVSVLPVRRTHYSNNPEDIMIFTEYKHLLKKLVHKKLREGEKVSSPEAKINLVFVE